MRWLFDSKKKPARSIDDIRAVGKHMMRVQSLNIFGPFSESKNGQYLLVRQDSDRQRGIGGYRESGNGTFVLVSQGQVVCVGECERPTEGDVANDGTFAIIDTFFGDKLGSKLYVHSADGTILYAHVFSANTLNIGISAEGTYVVAQLAYSSTEDSGKFYLFDTRKSKVISVFVPLTGWADKYEFSLPNKIVYLCYKNNRRYGYSFDGTFLDSQLYDHEQVEDASPTDLVLIVREKLNNATNDQLPALLALINRALDGDLSKYDDYRALGFRLKGEILEPSGDLEGAISAYKEALNIDPKIGVKQRLKKLEECHKLSGSPAAATQRKLSASKTLDLIPISSEKVREVLYNFTQYAFIGGAINNESLDAKHFPKVLAILRSGTLTQHELAAQTLQVRRVFYELLMQYLMFLSKNRNLPFPPDFLAQSNAKVLGTQLTAYMAEHGWPFPQMLQQSQGMGSSLST